MLSRRLIPLSRLSFTRASVSLGCVVLAFYVVGFRPRRHSEEWSVRSRLAPRGSKSAINARWGSTPLKVERPVVFPINFSEFNLTVDLIALREAANLINTKQEIHNLLHFGPLAPDDPVILVQVHDRWHYLQHLLESLSRAQGIERALLIISHDYFDSHVDFLPSAIPFCKVMQIFFPYSTQLFPNQFPGRDPMDCSRDIGKEKAFQVNCLNAKYSDSYGHYRESKFTQIKHHWWWKINVVMDTLNVTRSHQGPVLLLEEDYYVAPDYLSAARLLLDNKQRFCGRNECLCMVGNIKSSVTWKKSPRNKVDIRRWANCTNNIGIVVTRDVWEAILRCQEVFCGYDDYNWDLTLTMVARTCLPKGRLAINYSVPRVFHIGDNGIHTKSKPANETLLKMARGHIQKLGLNDTRQMSLVASTQGDMHFPKPSGGWSDIRDQHLCMAMTRRIP